MVTNGMKKRTEIHIEVDQVMVVRVKRGTTAQMWCPGCASLTVMVTPEQATAIARVSVRVINRLVEAERVHFLETQDGLLLLCVRSLVEESARPTFPPTQAGQDK